MAARVARVLRRRRRVLGGRPAAARRASSAWRASQAVRMRWLRTASRQASQSISGARPIRRGQPRAVVVLAGAFGGGEGRSGPGGRADGVGGGLGGGWGFVAGVSGTAGGDGDGLLLAAGGRVVGWGEDLGPVAVQGHGGGPQRAADLARGRGAGDAVVAVGVVAGDPAELVPGGLGGLLVV